MGGRGLCSTCYSRSTRAPEKYGPLPPRKVPRIPHADLWEEMDFLAEMGVTDNEGIARVLGVSVRTVQRARASRPMPPECGIV